MDFSAEEESSALTVLLWTANFLSQWQERTESLQMVDYHEAFMLTARKAELLPQNTEETQLL